mgnify:CR=1 FL=1
MTIIIDYGVGNLFSLRSSFAYVGENAEVSSDPEVIRNADRIILPGVGAFADAADKLKTSGMYDLVKELAAQGKPLLGVCLGMQLLFERSFEYGEHEGLGLIKGSVRPIADVIPSGYKIPHIGWNAIKFHDPCGTGDKSPIFKYINEDDHVYFVHSYYGADCEDSCIASCEYGAELTAAVAKGNVFGCQFHPEKSGKVGLNILKAFCEI